MPPLLPGRKQIGLVWYNTFMNGQIYATIEQLEQQVKSLKKIVKQAEGKKSKKAKKKSALIGIWKGLNITDEEIEQAKKNVFDFDVEKYVK